LLVWLGTAGAGPLSIDHLIQCYQGQKAPAPIFSRHASAATV
jgi:hypothetical protein